jgi:hypothetical protein
MTEEKIFRTDFINDRDSHVPIFDLNGKLLTTLPPKSATFLEAWDPNTTWARWREVRFLADGSTKVLENKDWKNPFSGWTIELRNDTHAVKVITIDDQHEKCFPGVPRDVPIPLNDQLIFYKSIRWFRETVKVPDPSFPVYLVERIKDVKKIEPRGVRELQKIKAALKEIAGQRTEVEIDRRAPKPKPNDDEGEINPASPSEDKE